MPTAAAPSAPVQGSTQRAVLRWRRSSCRGSARTADRAMATTPMQRRRDRQGREERDRALHRASIAKPCSDARRHPSLGSQRHHRCRRAPSRRRPATAQAANRKVVPVASRPRPMLPVLPRCPRSPPISFASFFFFFLFPWRAALFFFFFCSSFFFPLLIPTLAPMRARARARLMRASIIGLRSQQRQARHHRVTPQAGSTREQRTAGKKGVRPGGRASMGDHPERAAASTGPTAGARHTHHGSRRGSRHPGSRRHGSRHGRDRGHGHACTWLPRPCLARSSALGPP